MVWDGAGMDTQSAAQGVRLAVSEKEVAHGLSLCSLNTSTMILGYPTDVFFQGNLLFSIINLVFPLIGFIFLTLTIEFLFLC